MAPACSSTGCEWTRIPSSRGWTLRRASAAASAATASPACPAAGTAEARRPGDACNQPTNQPIHARRAPPATFFSYASPSSLAALPRAQLIHKLQEGFFPLDFPQSCSSLVLRPSCLPPPSLFLSRFFSRLSWHCLSPPPIVRLVITRRFGVESVCKRTARSAHMQWRAVQRQSCWARLGGAARRRRLVLPFFALFHCERSRSGPGVAQFQQHRICSYTTSRML